MKNNREPEDKGLNVRCFWGEALKKPFVEFRRRSPMSCVYCGGEADTREHCPPRTFLDPPLPTDLPTVPACRTCNNGFSADEKYVKHVLDNLFMHYELGDDSFCLMHEGECKEVKEARESVKCFIKEPFFDSRIAKIFRKIAIGHVCYELSEELFLDGQEETIQVSYGIRQILGEEAWNNIGCIEDITNDVLPELGSRAYDNIYIVESFIPHGNDTKELSHELQFIEWTSLQDGNYKYVAFLRDNKIFVKIIFRDFFYVEVTFCK